jgi:hypothetical protein
MSLSYREQQLVAGRPDANDLVVSGRSGRPPSAGTLTKRKAVAWQTLKAYRGFESLPLR